jgi:hypothetical protein
MYIAGLVSPAEKRRLEDAGYELEECPKELQAPLTEGNDSVYIMIWLDRDIVETVLGDSQE